MFVYSVQWGSALPAFNSITVTKGDLWQTLTLQKVITQSPTAEAVETALQDVLPSSLPEDFAGGSVCRTCRNAALLFVISVVLHRRCSS